MSENKIYSLWMEGYACTGQSENASFLGDFTANSFLEACDKWAETLDENSKRFYRVDRDRAYFWGCRIYDNETDARRCFG